jgi:hypothetical protein
MEIKVIKIHRDYGFGVNVIDGESVFIPSSFLHLDPPLKEGDRYEVETCQDDGFPTPRIKRMVRDAPGKDVEIAELKRKIDTLMSERAKLQDENALLRSEKPVKEIPFKVRKGRDAFKAAVEGLLVANPITGKYDVNASLERMGMTRDELINCRWKRGSLEYRLKLAAVKEDRA